VRDGRGGRGEGLAGPRAGDHGDAARLPQGGGGADPHLLGRRGRAHAALTAGTTGSTRAGRREAAPLRAENDTERGGGNDGRRTQPAAPQARAPGRGETEQDRKSTRL